jgi:hypothetical protein
MVENLVFKVEGTTLTITADLTKNYGRTKKGEGKNISIASTGGNCEVAPGISAGINIYRKPKQGE